MTDEEQKKIFSRNLNHYVSLSNKTQKEIADSIDVSPQTFNTWCQGIAIPRMGKVQRLADYFNVGKSDLIDDKLFSNTNKSKGVTINVLGRVAAGLPIEAIENVIDTEEITEELARTGDFFGLQIHGDSMEPRIYEGDIVIVRQQDDAESGDVVIAMVNGNDATCKRLRKYRDGIELISNNPSYAPMFFSNEEILSKPVKIIGKVVELRGKF
ncbi:XRE family transcriptional regulator [Lachnospiraceae bacterium 38-10]